MPTRSTVDIQSPSAYFAEAVLANPQNLTPGVDNQGANSVLHIVMVKTLSAGSVLTLFDSDDNSTFAAPADASYIVTNNANDLLGSVAGVKMLAYVGPKRYSVVRNSGGTPTASTFALLEYLGRTNKAQQL